MWGAGIRRRTGSRSGSVWGKCGGNEETERTIITPPAILSRREEEIERGDHPPAGYCGGRRSRRRFGEWNRTARKPHGERQLGSMRERMGKMNRARRVETVAARFLDANFRSHSRSRRRRMQNGGS